MIKKAKNKLIILLITISLEGFITRVNTDSKIYEDWVKFVRDEQ